MARETPYDDVFRTLVTKRPDMLIALVNEMFSLSYASDSKVQLRNDIHFITDKRIETDSIFQINNDLFHIECQSSVDNTISIRIIEYDFIAVLESAQKDEDGIYHLKFPKSGIFMLRQTKTTKDQEIVRLHFADGSQKDIVFQVIKAKDYDLEHIFCNNLFFLIPFYIMRYEKLPLYRGKHRADMKKKMLFELDFIMSTLYDFCIKENKEDLYADIREMTEKIALHVFRKSKIKEEVDETMKKRIYDLPSDKLREAKAEGLAEGKAEAKTETILSLVRRKLLTDTQGAKELGISLTKLNSLL